MKLKPVIEAARKLAARRRLGDPVIAAWERRAKRAALVAAPVSAATAAYTAGREGQRRQRQPQTFIVRAPKGTGQKYAHEAQALARDLQRGPSFVGPRGGRYYLTKSGAKVYVLR